MEHKQTSAKSYIDRQEYYRLCLVRAKRLDAKPEYDYFIVTNKGCIYNIKQLIRFLFNKRTPIYDNIELIADAPYKKIYDLVYREIIDHTGIPYENHKLDNVDSYLFDNFMVKFKPEMQYMAVTKFLGLLLYQTADKPYVRDEVSHGSLAEILAEFDLTKQLETNAIYK